MAGRTRARTQSTHSGASEQASTAIVPFDAKAASEKLVTALEARRDQIVSFLGNDPKYAQRFLSVATDAIVRDRNLLSADLFSLVAAVRHAAIMGLEPTSVMGEGAIVVYRDNDQGGKRIAQFQPMVRGLAKLARNSGQVAAIGVDVRHEKDEFEFESGSNPRILHRPHIDGDPGAMLGAYAYVRLTSGELVPLYMSVAEIEKRRKVSKSWQQSGEKSIWGSWPEEMAKKTVLRRLLVEKVPLSFEAVRALALDAEIDKPGGDPEHVEATVSASRTVARLTAHLDVDEPEPLPDDTAGRKAVWDAANAEDAAQAAQKASPEPGTVEGVAKDVGPAAGRPEPSVCGKPGMREGVACESAKGHPGPHHSKAAGEWL